jgi:hypothetical protein
MMGTIFLKLGKTWMDSYSYTSVMFFIVAFLTFMSIAGFPAFGGESWPLAPSSHSLTLPHSDPFLSLPPAPSLFL